MKNYITHSFSEAISDAKKASPPLHCFYGQKQFNILPSQLNSLYIALFNANICFNSNVINLKVIDIDIYSLNSIQSISCINRETFPNLESVGLLQTEQCTIKYLNSIGIHTYTISFNYALRYTFTHNQDEQNRIKAYILQLQSKLPLNSSLKFKLDGIEMQKQLFRRGFISNCIEKRVQQIQGKQKKYELTVQISELERFIDVLIKSLQVIIQQ